MEYVIVPKVPPEEILSKDGTYLATKNPYGYISGEQPLRFDASVRKDGGKIDPVFMD